MNGRKLKILSFNWHEPYLCMLAATRHEFLIFEPLMPDGLPRRWDVRMRPLPGNATIVSAAEMQRMLGEGEIDLIICQNVKDIIAVSSCQKIPKILVFHNKLTTELALGGNSVRRDDYLKQIEPLLHGVTKVFISRPKKEDWAMDGSVIPPGINADDYGGYEGERAEILRVGNRLKERDLMMGFSEQEEICNGFDSTIVGDNPALGTDLSGSWEDLKSHYQKCRLYLNTTKHPYEDGYNLAMLEAMAAGMPIISLSNPTSPLTDGVEGFIADSVDSLRSRARRLLEDRELALKMGRSARELVIEKFPMDKFVKDWNEVIANAVNSGKGEERIEIVGGPARVWMDYAYYPVTTAHYMRRAFEKENSLITSGGSITPEIIKLWNLENMKADIIQQDIPRSEAVDAQSVFKRLPPGFSPDFFIWVETGLEPPPAGIENLSVPTAAYLIDTHLNLDSHLQVARMFDVVFLAQKEYVETFRKKGIRNVHWLPLACDPEIHGKRDAQKVFDIGFAGSVTESPSHIRRKKLLGSLRSEFYVEVRRVFLDEMARLFSSSRIVFNNAIKNDLNMRVFEALCSGSLLLTDDAEGLSDFFRDGKELVIYNDENIVELARYYLQNEREREEIANRGREKVLAEHTYSHRAKQVVETMRGISETIDVRSEKPDYYYRGERPEVVAMVPDSAMRILEVGCGAGVTSRMLKEDNRARVVVGVEYDAAAAKEASKHIDRVFQGDVERLNLPYPDGYFDCIIYADVLEHLRDPEKLLKKHKRHLSKNGVMVMSIPNTRHFSVVNQLLEGRWTYVESGLLDSTHIRFFTLAEIKDMLKRCGLMPLEIKGKRADKVYTEGSHGTLKIGRWQIDRLSEEEMLDFFVFQYLIAVGREPEAVVSDEPFDPGWFRDLIEKEKRFKQDSDEPLAAAGNCILSGEYEKAAALLDTLNDEADPGILLWVGHLNMALGRFLQAESVYRRIGSEKFAGCSLAARGLLTAALNCWWNVRRDEQAAGWLESFGGGRYGREESLLAAAEDGNGVRLSAYDKSGEAGGASFKNLNYISSFHRLENEDDIVQALMDWRESLSDGGVLALLCAHSSAGETDFYPVPKHRFTPESLEKIVWLVGGLEPVTVKNVYEGKSFLSVFQKRDAKNIGRKFDYDARLRKLLSGRALERSPAYWEKGFFEASGQCAEAALSLNPDNPEALTKAGDCLMKKGDAPAAAQKYERALALSGSSQPLIGMGTLKLTEADFELAAQFFNKALAADPENDRAVCGLGLSLFNLGKREEGFELYIKAFRINPENKVALSSIVKAGYALNKLEPVENALKRFLELHSANIDILFSLAGILFTAGKADEAREILEKLFMFAPDHVDAKRLCEKIEAEEKNIRV